jgi:dTDP-4-dehydrorhamnose reductase
MKIMIIGADGQLGSDLCRVIPPAEQIPLTIRDLDVTDRRQVAEVLKRHRPDVVINTAAYTNVEGCEDHETVAFAVNAIGVKYLADACRESGSVLVHLSTDYVFDGAKRSPYEETDCPGPQSVYGISKLAGEHCLRSRLEKYFIVRSSGLYGCAGCLGKGGGNFVENMIERAAGRPELSVVTDEMVSPTYTADLAAKLYQLIGTGRFGLYHIVNHGECSWYDFTAKIFELLDRPVKIKPILASGYQSKARRPHYSVLKNARLAALGLDDLRPWPAALKAYLTAKGHLGGKGK